MTPEQERKLEEVHTFMSSLRSSTTIPYDVDGAFRTRLGANALSTSGKGATSENKTVNEAGSSTYSVLLPPDGFLQVMINGSTYYLPFYS